MYCDVHLRLILNICIYLIIILPAAFCGWIVFLRFNVVCQGCKPLYTEHSNPSVEVEWDQRYTFGFIILVWLHSKFSLYLQLIPDGFCAFIPEKLTSCKLILVVYTLQSSRSIAIVNTGRQQSVFRIASKAHIALNVYECAFGAYFVSLP